jgi:MFS family permease
MMLAGMAGLVAGVGITLLGVSAASAAWFFAGTAVAGAGFGAGFQGAIRTVLPHAAAHERAGVLSTLWVVSYLALGLPGVVAGYLVVHDGGLLPTTREYGVAVMALAALAVLGLALSRRLTRRRTGPIRRFPRQAGEAPPRCHTALGERPGELPFPFPGGTP